MTKGYNEQTLVHPQDGHAVCGMDGYWWYADKETIEKHFKDWPTTPTLNPVWHNLEGMTKRKLKGMGFIE